MRNREKILEEAKKYKNLPSNKLKKVIKSYKSLSRSNSDIYNFLFSLIIMIISAFFLMEVTIGLLLILMVIHYLFFWEYLHKYKKVKLVSDDDKEEIDEIIQILEDHLKERETKNPSE